MAGPPGYAAEISNLPPYMYLRNATTADDASIWVNSYYNPGPATTPAGTTRVNWVNLPTAAAPQNAIATTSLARFAAGFTPNKSELLPIPQPAIDANRNLSQNPGY
jgi:hypothetical protein